MSETGYIQTVLGPLEPSDMGITLPHEHVLLDMTMGAKSSQDLINATESTALASDVPEAAFVPGEGGSRMAATFADKWGQPVTLQNRADIERNWFFYGVYKRRDLDVAVSEANLFKMAGGSCLVDQTPIGLGRDPVGLAQVSRLTGVHIVMGTGYYVHEYHPAEAEELSEDELVDRFSSEIETGVAGGIKAGIIGEVGLSTTMHPRERKGLRAAARAQARTGVPVSIHPGYGSEAIYDAVREVEDAGGDLGRTAISHVEGRVSHAEAPNSFDTAPVVELAKTGVWMSIDTFGWETAFRQRGNVDAPNDAVRLNYAMALAEAGYEDRILISSDLAIEHWERGKGGWGWQHIPETVVLLMQAKGFDQALIDKILIENPRRFLTVG